jgi:hypothetical protein
MRTFVCEHCGERLFFENTRCLACGHPLGFAPGELTLHTFRSVGDDHLAVVGDPGGKRWKMCRNYVAENVCNWMVPAEAGEDYCLSCRLNEVIPDLSMDRNRVLWAKMEAAKRRLLYSLLNLRLPLPGKQDDTARGLAFRFLAELDDDFSTHRRVLTGHERGVITINIAEADDAVRERMRLDMREVYRTLLGHFRHESGHYFWDRLFADEGKQEAFRAVFGDERLDYGEALSRHHRDGAPSDWPRRYISAYATVHPWEDWAETWAHYLHITDTLETAWHNGIEIRHSGGRHAVHHPASTDFAAVVEDWHSLRFVLNSLNRSMGLNDPYPFVLNPPVVEKLAFIHHCLGQRTAG